MSIRMRWLAAPVMAGAAIVFTAASAFAASAPIAHAASPNWAGFATGQLAGPPHHQYPVPFAPGTFTEVSAQWRVPQIPSCKVGADQTSLVWVGLDGAFINRNVEQVGTAQECKNGAAVYTTFYELAPAAPVHTFAVNAGDVMQGSVRSLPHNRFLLSIKDVTTEEQYHVNVQGSSDLPYGQSAEAIYEVPLHFAAPHIRSVSFSEVTINDQPMASFPLLQTAMFLAGPPSLFPPTYVPSLPGADGESFYVAVLGYTPPPAVSPEDHGNDAASDNSSDVDYDASQDRS